MENGNQTPAVATGQNATPQNTAVQSSNAIDYDKIQSMIDTRNQRNEQSILKSYFQQQGLSEEEAKQAMDSFKSQREENNKKQVEDNKNLLDRATKAENELMQSRIENIAYIQSQELGVDIKTLPYLTKLADFSNVKNEKGEIVPEKVKEALNKVLTDVPSLKSEKNGETVGVKVGADASSGSQPSGNLFGFNFTGVRKHD